jgi:hypothetical protein
VPLPDLIAPPPPPPHPASQDCLPKSMAVGREILRGRRTFCSVQVDFVDLPPNHRLLPIWETRGAVSPPIPCPLLRPPSLWQDGPRIAAAGATAQQ